MIREDQQWSKTSKKENLKEMGDVTSGMASTVIQLYLKPILDCFIHASLNVRQSAFRVVQLILQQGLVYKFTFLCNGGPQFPIFISGPSSSDRTLFDMHQHGRRQNFTCGG